MGSPARHTRYATKGLSGGEGTNKGEKLVGCRSNRDHRCGDCCGHSAVKSGWRDVRCGHTEEEGRCFARNATGEDGSSYSERSETMYVSRLTFHTTPGKTHEGRAGAAETHGHGEPGRWRRSRRPRRKLLLAIERLPVS